MDNRRNENHTKASPANIQRMKELMLKSDNCLCADCGDAEPKWASTNIGVFICQKCCDAHKTLGSHISKVLSLNLDQWSDEQIDSMLEIGGNSSANAIYEAFIPKGYLKPSPESNSEERTFFIRSKYELQEFLKPSLRIVSFSSAKSSLQTSDSNKTQGFLSSITSRKMEGMVESIGSLKVKVIKGTNLAVRDFLTSDPYVIAAIGEQKAQTTVMSSNLNPVWNEELILSVPRQHVPLKLQVFDYDTFSADDIMGEAEVDIQPIITAAMTFGNAEKFKDMPIGKWLKAKENPLIEDSIVRIVGGKIIQHVSLKLQNVESGELELELQWMPANH